GGAAWQMPLDGANLHHGAAYTAYSRAVDGAGNTQSPAASSSFQYDSQPPPAPLLSGIAEDTGSVGDRITADTTLVFSGTAEALAAVTVLLAGEVLGSCAADGAGAWSLDASASPLAEGIHAVSLRATDTAGNQGPLSPEYAVEIDSHAPAVGFVAPAAGASVNGLAAIAFTDDDPHDPEVSADGSTWVPALSGATLLGAVQGFAELAEGAFTLSLRDRDVAGNEGTDALALVKDTTAPVGYAAAFDQAFVSGLNHAAITFTVSGAEVGATCHYTVSGVARTTLSGSFSIAAATQQSPVLDLGALPDGALGLAAVLRDGAGNEGVPAGAQIQKDTQAPAGYAFAVDQAYVNAANQAAVTLTLTAGEIGATYAVYVGSSGGGTQVSATGTLAGTTEKLGPLDVSGLGDGLLSVLVSLTDPFGNAGANVVRTVTKDVVPPAPPAADSYTDPVNAATVGSFAFTGTADPMVYVDYRIAPEGPGPTLSGTVAAAADGTFGAIGIDLASLPDGALILALQARDAAGNPSGWGTFGPIAKDTSVPEPPLITSIPAFVNAANAAAFPFSGSAPDSVAVDYTLATPGGEPVLNGSLPVAPEGAFDSGGLDLGALADGVYRLILRARDAVGNRSDPTQSDDIPKDTAAPQVLILTPVDGVRVNALAELSFTDSDPHAPQVSCDGTTWGDAVSGTTTMGALPGFDALAEGAFTLILRDIDPAGNEGRHTVLPVKDTLAPTGYTVAFEPDWVHAGNQGAVVFALAGAESGTTCVYAVADDGGGEISGTFAVGQAGQKSPPLDLTSLEDGVLHLEVFLRDAAGNTGPTAMATAPKDTVPPTGYTVAFHQAGINLSNRLAVSFSVADAETAAVYRYTMTSSGGGAPLTGSGSVPGPSFDVGPLNASALGDGMVTVVVSLTDAAGNKGSDAAATLRKDVVPPALPAILSHVEAIHAGNTDAFAFAGTAEAEALLRYRVTSDAGGTPVEGALAVGAEGTFTASGVAVDSLPDGMLTLACRVEDAVGNPSGWQASAPIPKDTLAPEPPLIGAVLTAVNAANVHDFSFAGAAEPGAMVDYAVDTIPPSAPLTGTVPAAETGAFAAAGIDLAPLADGICRLSLTARDALGNAGLPALSDPIVKDTVIPTLTILSPAAGAEANGAWPVNATASETVSFLASLDALSWVPVAPGTTLLSEIPTFLDLPDGEVTLYLRGDDAVGNGTEETVTFTKDTAAPAGYTVGFPAAFHDRGESVLLALSFSGAEAGSRCLYEIRDEAGGSVAGEADVLAPAQDVDGIDISALGFGVLTATVILRDAAGNPGDPATDETILGVTAVIPLRRGWNTFGVPVHPLDTVETVAAEAAARPDGALVRGAFHGCAGGLTALVGDSRPAYGAAYRVFADRGGSLLLRGVPGSGLGTLAPGWNLVSPGSDMTVEALGGEAAVWTESHIPAAYHRLPEGHVVRAGDVIWVYEPGGR
ncbi:MAG: hypothetical protein JXR77_04900, partial [Lentisphaeria bacterium]|nr:hypothetical protein [Lentisphaeria bacterium]